MFRNMEGHGCLITRNPPDPGGTLWPSRSTTSAITPGNGRVAEPGLVAMAPGSGEIIVAPVSVCHQVSIIGQRPPPITSRYHIQASGLMGSPTLPSSRSELRSCLRGHCSHKRITERIELGAL